MGGSERERRLPQIRHTRYKEGSNAKQARLLHKHAAIYKGEGDGGLRTPPYSHAREALQREREWSHRN